jgi:hypothetical protein
VKDISVVAKQRIHVRAADSGIGLQQRYYRRDDGGHTHPIHLKQSVSDGRKSIVKVLETSSEAITSDSIFAFCLPFGGERASTVEKALRSDSGEERVFGGEEGEEGEAGREEGEVCDESGTTVAAEEDLLNANCKLAERKREREVSR